MNEHWNKVNFSNYVIEILQSTEGGISGTGI